MSQADRHRATVTRSQDLTSRYDEEVGLLLLWHTVRLSSM